MPSIYFSYRDYNYFWVPVIGPHIGSVVGALIYQLCVGLHWPAEEVQLQVSFSGTNSKADTKGEHEYDGPCENITNM